MPQQVVPNSAIGLGEPGKPAGEIALPVSLFKYIHAQKEAPAPKQTVGKAQTLRERILTVSLFPDIYTRHK